MIIKTKTAQLKLLIVLVVLMPSMTIVKAGISVVKWGVVSQWSNCVEGFLRVG